MPTTPPNIEYLKGILEGSFVYTGLRQTQGSFTWAQAEWDAWHSYMSTRTAQDVPVASASGDGVVGSGARSQATDLGANESSGMRTRMTVETVMLVIGLCSTAFWIA
jgi:hypothetical protein